MAEQIFSYYDNISRELKAEEMVHLDRLMNPMLAEAERMEFNLTEEEQIDAYRHDIKMLSLYALRIWYGCQLMKEGYFNKEERIGQDIIRIAACVRELEMGPEGSLDSYVITDALDVILSVCVGYEDIVYDCLQQEIEGFRREEYEVVSELYDIFSAVIGFYRDEGMWNLAVQVAEQLVVLSRKRNRDNLLWHQDIVVQVLPFLGDRESRKLCRICEEEENCFSGSQNENTGKFFWWYASALHNTGSDEKAQEYYWRCYSIWKGVYGEENWFTLMARRGYCLLCLIKHEKEEECLCFLIYFISKMAHGDFQGIVKSQLVKEILGQTIYCLFEFGAHDIVSLHIRKYIGIYEELCNIYDKDPGQPLIKRRLAYCNGWGRYYYAKGDYLQAEKAFCDALAAALPEGTKEIIAEESIKGNLLLIYTCEKEGKKASVLARELMKQLEREKSRLKTGEKLRLLALCHMAVIENPIEKTDEDIRRFKQDIAFGYEKLERGIEEYAGYARELAAYIISAIYYLLDPRVNIDMESDNDRCFSIAADSEYRFYLELLQKIAAEESLFGLNAGQSAMMQCLILVLRQELELPVSEKDIIRCIETARRIELNMQASLLTSLAGHFCKMRKWEQGRQLLEEALGRMTELWHSYVKYYNDARLRQILDPLQGVFRKCYVMFRQQADVQSAYEKVLQFKVLASLAGRERNRILHSGGVDMELVGRIQKLQDRIAAFETDELWLDMQANKQKAMEQLRELEAEFGRCFPQNVRFHDISWQAFCKAMPEHTALVEYFMCITDYGVRYKEIQKYTLNQIYDMDIYIIRKEKECTVERISAPDGFHIWKMAWDFVAALNFESRGWATTEQLQNKDAWRASLYRLLLEPVLERIGEVDTLYIAPDPNICNLPFEILGNTPKDTLESRYHVVKIECGRDLIFCSEGGETGTNSLVIGNPTYKIEERNAVRAEREQDSDIRYRPRADMKIVQQLPFSEIEALKVARYLDTSCYVGRQASKEVFFSAKNIRNIHISTHGGFDLGKEKDAMYSAYLLFAGAENWLRKGEAVKGYGNGILTADEISRMDLRKTELVVLSACFSGMSETDETKSFQGMISAFAAAGVRYVISHTWAAGDYVSMILMDAFYREYTGRHLSPPQALHNAKQYVKNLTVGQMRQDGWFDCVPWDTISDREREYIKSIKDSSDRVKPFRGEVRWGGFSCYRCN